MNSEHSTAGIGEPTVVITRITHTQWHALDNDRVVGRGDASRRPDGRIFLGIDYWHDAVFDQLAHVMSTDLPNPLYTVVDETDVGLTSCWERVGFTIRRREWEYVVPTDPRVTGLDATPPPPDTTIVAAGDAEQGPLHALDRAIRLEVEAAMGWQQMPAEVLPCPSGNTPLDLSKYVVAAQHDRYVGLVRVMRRRHWARIGLIAVRADQHRRGIARALLSHTLGALHHSGIDTVSTEVDESNTAATALFEGIGARRASSNLELVLR
ncbi:GNAT family N-acetyltransferase [Nocardia sp. CA-135398]|uniref:GNAT family N-acetyltransferase n=1 Tax=Nocardia sp. CA-135398 TaxID=3239977 RepID=UPI003D997DF7